eukprot:8950014-Lingulodinium_polyedra.AAC.1
MARAMRPSARVFRGVNVGETYQATLRVLVARLLNLLSGGAADALSVQCQEFGESHPYARLPGELHPRVWLYRTVGHRVAPK